MEPDKYLERYGYEVDINLAFRTSSSYLFLYIASGIEEIVEYFRSKM